MNKDLLGVWLSRVSILGLAFFLCAPWFLSSNTHYHRLIIFFFWIPSFLHFCIFFRDYPPLSRFFLWTYLLLSIWYILIIALTADDQSEWRDMKTPLYVAFHFLGFMTSAMFLKERLSGFILLCCIFGGILAGISWIDFYFIQDRQFQERLVSIGLWKVVVPAAQACGVLMILTVLLGFEGRRSPWVLCGILLALLGYGLFLYSNQTRWIWLCLILSFVIAGILLKNKKICILAAVSALLMLLILLIKPDLLLNRGFSSRPVLWLGGFTLFLENWELGLGLKEYLVKAEITNEINNHPHNMFLDIGIRFGLVGLLLWVGIWTWAGWKAFKNHKAPLGMAVLILWLYSGLVVLTDGTAPWEKPSTIWFVTWLPLMMVLIMDARSRQGAKGAVHV